MFPPLRAMADDSIVNILHSSGSTGMPRAIKYHLEGLFKNLISQRMSIIQIVQPIKLNSTDLLIVLQHSYGHMQDPVFEWERWRCPHSMDW